MLKLAQILILIFLYSCSFSQNKGTIGDILNEYDGNKFFEKNIGDTVIIQGGPLFSKNKAHAIVLTEITSNEFKLSLFKKAEDWICLYTDTLEFGLLVGIEKEDYNFDECNDLLLKTISGEPWDILYIFDNKDGVLRRVQETDINMSDIRKLANGSNFLYNLVNIGCAGQYWKSELFSIEDFKVQKHGELIVNGCDSKLETTINIINKGQRTVVKNPQINLGGEIDDSLKIFWGSFIRLHM